MEIGMFKIEIDFNVVETRKYIMAITMALMEFRNLYFSIFP